MGENTSGRPADYGFGGAVNRRIVATRYGGPETMSLVEEAIPEPGYGQVRVKVTAAEVNFTDLLLREGLYPGGPKPPFTPGYDLVGVVDSVGPGVEGWRIGQSVAALTVHGAYTDYLLLPARSLAPVPPQVDPLQALSLVLSYVTAYQLLHRAACVRPGEQVLFQGAAGAVGTAVLQLGRLEDLRLYGTETTHAVPVVTALGATAIDHTQENIVDRVRELSGGGVDVVLDGIGGRTSWSSYRSLRPGGRLVLFGHTAALPRGRRTRLRTIGFYLALVSVCAAAVLSGRRKLGVYRIAELRDRHPDWFHDDLQTLFSLLSEGRIHPYVPPTLPLAQASEAHARLLAKRPHKQILLCAPSASPRPRAEG